MEKDPLGFCILKPKAIKCLRDMTWGVDLDKGTVTTSLYMSPFSISNITENRIEFTAPSNQDGFTWQGSVDRYTGFVAVMHKSDRLVTMAYNLNCK
jgi:hypothetical protein